MRSTKKERRKGKDAGRFRKCSSDDVREECGGRAAAVGRSGGGWVWMCSAMALLGFAIDDG